MKQLIAAGVVVAGLAVAATQLTSAQAPKSASSMTFFITSAGPGKGADLGGLKGADAYCQTLAAAVGAGSHEWHAYLSTSAADGQKAINAKDRIGSGPWTNAKGVQIAANLADLHSENAKTGKEGSLNEKGEVVNGRGDNP